MVDTCGSKGKEVLEQDTWYLSMKKMLLQFFPPIKHEQFKQHLLLPACLFAQKCSRVLTPLEMVLFIKIPTF